MRRFSVTLNDADLDPIPGLELPEGRLFRGSDHWSFTLRM
jgi:hypothetical protein